MILSKAFWRDALERVIATGAQAVLAVLPTSLLPDVSVPWWSALVAGAFASALSLLKCLAASRVGDNSTASLIEP